MTDKGYEVDRSRMLVGIAEVNGLCGAETLAGKPRTVSQAGGMAREASCTGRELLSRLLREEFEIDISAENDPIGREAGGKPFLRNHEDVYFNISHSGKYAACVVARVPVGIDIQYHKEVNVEKMGKKILSEMEWGALGAAGCSLEGFYDFWTKKESFLKFTGEGIRRELKGLEYEGCRFMEMNFQIGYSGMICVPEEWDGEMIVKRGEW